MNYEKLFQNGSLRFVSEFVGKIVYDGLQLGHNERSEFIIGLVSVLIIVFVLYKLV